jgi:uncharacterized linocin/CFP29 family protein
MNNLLRELAPITPAAWEEIEEEAKRTLKLTLAARKIVDFTGPLGWSYSAVDSGRIDALNESPGANVHAQLRRVQPLVELRAPFTLSRSELESIARGSKDADLQPVIEAARTIAMAEDRAIFHGYAAGHIEGISKAAPEKLSLTDDYEKYPNVVAEALSKLRQAGIAGPYAIALGPRCYKGLTETTTRGGYRVFDFVQRLLDGPVVWAPAVDGAVVISLRGGDFELVVGQDFSIGYLTHNNDSVQLYLQESFTFRTLAPEAAVPLTYSTVQSSTSKQ